ncbi:MAG TPA: Bd3614 family nucleic acid deaminase, partial [Bdellovibrionales bacterium]|nr:Bd3614 family nucleic acid deaminase [Bdellovibrionales bacterium]
VAHNTNHSNRTLHAELNLVQSWWRMHQAPLPAGAEIYTTLEPCRMCSGMIHHAGPETKVWYLEPDDVPPVPWALNVARFTSRE